MSAGGHWSEELYVAARLRRANNNWGNSSYIIAKRDQTQPTNIGDHKTGVYARQQLLHCPLKTMDYLSSDDDDDSSSDDESKTTRSRGLAVQGQDVLLFKNDLFNAQPGGLNGL